jgi:hypothetical protein
MTYLDSVNRLADLMPRIVFFIVIWLIGFLVIDAADKRNRTQGRKNLQAAEFFYIVLGGILFLVSLTLSYRR